MLLRVAIILQTLALFAAPVTAGLLLSVPNGQPMHSAAAYTVFVVAVLHLVAAILAWRPGGGPPKPIMHAAGFLVLVSAQVALGIAQVTALHVPLGVLLFAGSVLQLSRAWTARSSDRDSRTLSSV